MAAPTIDLSRHPLLIVRFDGRAADHEFEAYLRELARLLIEDKRKTVTILDASQAERAPATQRKMQAEWLKAHENLLRRNSLGTAFVITSQLVRGVLTAILWLQPLPTEYAVVATLAAAEQWARARLAAAGLSGGATGQS